MYVMTPKIQALLFGVALAAAIAAMSWYIGPTGFDEEAPDDESHAASVAMEGGPGTDRPAPAIALPTFDGQPWSLAAQAGKATLVVFWASWCPSCREEAPRIEKLRQALAGKPFTVVGVNVQDQLAAAKAAVAELGLGYPSLVDDGSQVAQAYRIRALPTLILVDKAGTIRYQGHQLPPDGAIEALL